MSAAEIQNELDFYETLLESLRFAPEYSQSSPREEYEARIDELKSQLWTVQDPDQNPDPSQDRQSQSQSQRQDELEAAVGLDDHSRSHVTRRPHQALTPTTSTSSSSSFSSSSSSFSPPPPPPSLRYRNPALNTSDHYHGLIFSDLNSTVGENNNNNVWSFASDSTPSQTSASDRDAFSFMATMVRPQGSAFGPRAQMSSRKRPRESTGSHEAVSPHDVKSLRVTPSPQLTGPATPSTISSVDVTAE